MASNDAIATALALLSAHYPGEHPRIDAATVGTWAQTGLGGLTDETIETAAAEWDTTGRNRFPSSGEFLIEAQAVARRLMSDRAALHDEWNLPPGAADVPLAIVGGIPLPIVTDLDRHFVTAIRAGLRALGEGADYFDALNASLALHELAPVEAEEPIRVLGGEVPLAWRGRADDNSVRCLRCGDSGAFIRTTVFGSESVRPCEHCRPIAFRRWSTGHRDVNHDCEECRLFRKGKPPVWAQELVAQGFDHR